MRVTLHATTPLRRLLLIEHNDVRKKFYLQYEKLADFCHAYGRFNHVGNNCFSTDVESERQQFGDWLRFTAIIPTTLEKEVVLVVNQC